MNFTIKLTTISLFILFNLSCGPEIISEQSNKNGSNINENEKDHNKINITSKKRTIKSRTTLNWSDFSTKNEIFQEQKYLSTSQNSTDLNVVVGILFDYTFSADNFAEPLDEKSSILSFGYLEISELRDNNLITCGPLGLTKCTNAQIIIYTQGTAGSGLYNADNDLSLPITSSGQNIGLGSENALSLGDIDITLALVVNLSDFTANPTLEIPISIDFSNAIPGTYTTQIVVEYFLY